MKIEKKQCVMCGNVAEYIDKKTGEALCVTCTNINESIYRGKGKFGQYKKC